jgi:hypothetical protein
MIVHDHASSRTLWSRDDRAALGAHLLRLGPEGRRRRFHGVLSDAAVAAHAARAFGPGRRGRLA